MSDKKVQTVPEIIAVINTRLDSVEDLLAFLVRADLRFKKGQLVQFSRKAARNGVACGKRLKLRGRVTHIDEGFTIRVLLDGQKHPHQYHHIFFDPIGKGQGVRNV